VNNKVSFDVRNGIENLGRSGWKKCYTIAENRANPERSSVPGRPLPTSAFMKPKAQGHHPALSHDEVRYHENSLIFNHEFLNFKRRVHPPIAFPENLARFSYHPVDFIQQIRNHLDFIYRQYYLDIFTCQIKLSFTDFKESNYITLPTAWC